MRPPFIVFGLPRSRTFWLSRFLTYGDATCGHEEIRHLRSLDDAKAWLSMPLAGTAETAAAPFWRTLRDLAPDARVVVVRRPVPEVLESLNSLRIPFNRPLLAKTIRGLDAKLGQVAARWPGALSVTFEQLREQEHCARVFEHCLPYKHDPAWWAAMAPLNLQIDMAAMVRYFHAYEPQLAKLAKAVRQRTLTELMLQPAVAPDGVTFQVEAFDAFYAGAQDLFREHLIAVGEAPDQAAGKNVALLRQIDGMGAMQVMTARSNGRMFGYLMTLISPSLEDPAETTAVHTTFYGSPAVPGLGMRLQRAALDALRKRGVDEVYFRAGTRGMGPRMGALYRRLGATEAGQLYHLTIPQEA